MRLVGFGKKKKGGKNFLTCLGHVASSTTTRICECQYQGQFSKEIRQPNGFYL